MKKEKSVQFNKLKNKTPAMPDLQEVKERGEPAETIEVWQSVDIDPTNSGEIISKNC